MSREKLALCCWETQQVNLHGSRQQQARARLKLAIAVNSGRFRAIRELTVSRIKAVRNGNPDNQLR